MQAESSKFYIAILLMGLCIVHAAAAPTKDGLKDVPSTDGSEESKEVENHTTGTPGGDSATSSVDSKAHDDSVQVPVKGEIHQLATVQVLPPQSANPSATTHVRVKRNKNPIRYHAKNIRRQ